MGTQKFSPSKVRVVAILDIVLTVALVTDIIGSTVNPAWTWRSWNAEEVQSEPLHSPKSNGPLLWIFLGAVVLFGLIAILAAVALLKSTTAKLVPSEALQIVRFWMHCNILTLLVTVLGFIVMSILRIDRPQIKFPLPTLVYFGIRLIFTWVIFLQLQVLRGPSPSLISSTIPLEEEVPRDGRRFYSTSIAKMDPPVTMGLAPYRGAKLSVPKCQCLAPQVG